MIKEKKEQLSKQETIPCDYCEGEGRYSLESVYQREENKIECYVCLGSGEGEPIMRTIPSGKTECVLCGKFEDERNILEQIDKPLCNSCYGMYDDDELRDELDHQEINNG